MICRDLMLLKSNCDTKTQMTKKELSLQLHNKTRMDWLRDLVAEILKLLQAMEVH